MWHMLVAIDDSSVTTCGICHYRLLYVATFKSYVAKDDVYIATFVCHDMWHMFLQMIPMSQHMAYVDTDYSSITTCGICRYR